MPTAYERGFIAGWNAAREQLDPEYVRYSDEFREPMQAKAPVSRDSSPKKKRKASAYSKKYARAFKKVAPKYKKKNGGWKKNGFKSAQAAAHKLAKKMR